MIAELSELSASGAFVSLLLSLDGGKFGFSGAGSCGTEAFGESSSFLRRIREGWLVSCDGRIITRRLVCLCVLVSVNYYREGMLLWRRVGGRVFALGCWSCGDDGVGKRDETKGFADALCKEPWEFAFRLLSCA